MYETGSVGRCGVELQDINPSNNEDGPVTMEDMVPNWDASRSSSTNNYP